MRHDGLDHARLHAAGWQSGWLRKPSPHQPPHQPLVVKLGGSLLDSCDWPARVTRLLEAIDRPLQLVVGGGAVVDGLRQLDAACPQPAERMHRLAIAAMDVTARLVAETLGLPLWEAPAVASDTSGVLLVRSWLDAGVFDRLPRNWSVTSDSLAAAIAAGSSQALLLVKSVPPPTANRAADPLAGIASSGWVDPVFPQAAASLTSLAWAAPLSGPS